MSVTARLKRPPTEDGRCLDVALEHGFFNEPSFLQDVEGLGSAVHAIAEAGSDAIRLTLGQATHLQSIPAQPSLVPRTLFCPVDDAVEQALRLDADYIVVSLFQLPIEPEVHHECVVNVSRSKPICARYYMPLKVEPLVMQANATAVGYKVDGDVQKIVSPVRQAVELGADTIKADPCDEAEEYNLVVESAGRCPVLPRGGGRVPTEEGLRCTKVLMAQGTSGIIYGRNIIQDENPGGMTQEEAMELLHDTSSLASC